MQKLEFDNCEVACIGAGIGGGFENTAELHVMKYDEAMQSDDSDNWKESVDDEHERMVKNTVFEAKKPEEVPDDAKIITSTWAMKKKSNGVYRARLNARGYEQEEGLHYDGDSISAPVATDITIRVCLVLMLMAGLLACILDIDGAFLLGEFENGEQIFMRVPQGWEEYYPEGTILLLLKTIYGLKQAAMAFWRKLIRAITKMKMKRNSGDPCLYYSWRKKRLSIFEFTQQKCAINIQNACQQSTH